MSPQGTCGPRHEKKNIVICSMWVWEKTQFFNPNLAENFPINTIAFIQNYSLNLGGLRGK